jgi:hypothetical protein
MSEIQKTVMDIEKWPVMLRGIFGYGLYGFLFLFLYAMFPLFLSKEEWLGLIVLASLFQYLVYPEYWRIYEKNRKTEFDKKESEYKTKMNRLNNLESTFKILYDARKDNHWQPTYDDCWKELYELIVAKSK